MSSLEHIHTKKKGSSKLRAHPDDHTLGLGILYRTCTLQNKNNIPTILAIQKKKNAKKCYLYRSTRPDK